MHEPPQWSRTVSDRAIITRAEVLEWVGVKSTDLRPLIDVMGFPPPRMTGIRNKAGFITSTCRWLAGDVRAWLNGSPGVRLKMSTKRPAVRIDRKARTCAYERADKTDKTCRD